MLKSNKFNLYAGYFAFILMVIGGITFLSFASESPDTTANAASAETPAPVVSTMTGALLPSHRIVAYYGNFESKRMGVLGQYPTDEMLSMLNKEVERWREADPKTPVIPGIDYIAVVAQGSPGADGMYRSRMPDSEIQKAITLANQIHGIAVLDLQIGHSTVEAEIPRLEQYLVLPNVMLALDPEFSMKTGVAPGREIGSLNAQDINFAIDYLAKLVKEHNLPPKILVIHRFTSHMVLDYKDIKVVPEVQIVMDMDGWGSKAKKTDTYDNIVHPQKVEFTGFKLFYVNDLKPPSTGLFSPTEILKLQPQDPPLYILYQ